MALESRHHKIAEAVRASLIADAELVGTDAPFKNESQWRLQKRPWHRRMSWEAGAYVCKLGRGYPDFESSKNQIQMPCLVAVVWPGDGSLTSNDELYTSVMERIETIFANKGRVAAPAPMRALDDVLTGEHAFKFEQTKVRPGEAYIEGAFTASLDAMACVVDVSVIACKRDSSLLGSV